MCSVTDTTAKDTAVIEENLVLTVAPKKPNETPTPNLVPLQEEIAHSSKVLNGSGFDIDLKQKPKSGECSSHAAKENGVNNSLKRKKIKSDKTPTNNLEQWAATKLRKEESLIQYFQKEHSLKIHSMKKKHELEMRFMRETAALEMAFLTKKQKLKLEILEIEKKRAGSNA